MLQEKSILEAVSLCVTKSAARNVTFVTEGSGSSEGNSEKRQSSCIDALLYSTKDQQHKTITSDSLSDTSLPNKGKL